MSGSNNSCSCNFAISLKVFDLIYSLALLRSCWSALTTSTISCFSVFFEPLTEYFGQISQYKWRSFFKALFLRGITNRITDIKHESVFIPFKVKIINCLR
eukprot:NODE_1334_length_1304_cov_0.572614.p2 type:complete len:100 gc:universal NODE_1334_length_1304_cov_0.572614:876-577(-)